MKFANRRAKLRQKLNTQQRVYGAWTGFSDPNVAELLASVLQPDFIGIDMEHSTLSLEQAKNLITTIQAQDCLALPRVSSHDSVQIQRLLDAGADGIIVPIVENVEQLEHIIEAMKYPPLGKRGFGISRAQGYGDQLEDYAHSWNEASILIIIIESVEGVYNVESLVKNPYVDGVLIGKYDISGSLNIPGKLTDEKVLAAEQVIMAGCQKHHKSYGVLLSDVTQSSLKNTDANFVILSMDSLILMKAVKEIKNLIK